MTTIEIDYEKIAIIRNKYTNSSGSLIAALNRTIDKAPTRPRDKAKDDLTIVIITIVVIAIGTKVLPKILLFDSACPNLT